MYRVFANKLKTEKRSSLECDSLKLTNKGKFLQETDTFLWEY